MDSFLVDIFTGVFNFLGGSLRWLFINIKRNFYSERGLSYKECLTDYDNKSKNTLIGGLAFLFAFILLVKLLN